MKQIITADSLARESDFKIIRCKEVIFHNYCMLQLSDLNEYQLPKICLEITLKL